MTTTAPVMSTGTWANNAELIRDAVVPLGYLRAEWRTLDPTYGLGRFWSLWRPNNLVAWDIVPAKSPIGYPLDFRHVDFPDDYFDAVVLDPPYKLNGTSTGKGAASSDEDYGVDRSAGVAERHGVILEGITEATRVLRPATSDPATGGVLLLKCQDQVCSGKVRWQTRIFADHAESLGHRLVDRFDLASYRAQPAGRRQVHARRNTSTLLVFRLEGEPTVTRPQNYEGEPLVVIWSHTVMDGVVVRWYANLAAAEARDELGSASRTRVSTGRLDLPGAVAMQMVAAHKVLRAGDVEAAKTLATHTKAWGGAISPVEVEA